MAYPPAPDNVPDTVYVPVDVSMHSAAYVVK
jgi:hypothetical protein